MKKICIGFMLLCSLQLNNMLCAQEVRHLSLNEAIRLGLEANKQLKSGNAALTAAEAKITEMKNLELPDIQLSGSYMRLNQANVSLSIPTNQGGDSTGTPGKGFPSVKVNQLMYGSVNASIPLFAGFKIRNGIEAAKLLKRATELDINRDREEIILNIITAYYNLYKAQSAVGLVNENLKQVKSRVKDFGSLEKNGLLARNDLLRAELQQSNAELTLAEAENNRRVSQYSTNLLLGLPENTQLALDEALLPEIQQLQSVEEWQKTAINSRTDLLSIQTRKLAAAKNTEITKAERYPSIALTGGYMAGYIPNVLTLVNAANIGLGISYNISSLYKSHSKIKQAKAQEEQLYWNILQVQDGIKIQVYQAYENYLQAIQKIQVLEKTVLLANENYRITKNKFDNQLETTTNLLDADVALLQARLNLEFAKADAVIVYNKLLESAGNVESSIKK